VACARYDGDFRRNSRLLPAGNISWLLLPLGLFFTRSVFTSTEEGGSVFGSVDCMLDKSKSCEGIW